MIEIKGTHKGLVIPVGVLGLQEFLPVLSSLKLGGHFFFFLRSEKRKKEGKKCKDLFFFCFLLSPSKAGT